MTQLPPELEHLIEHARGGHEPDPQAKARVRAALATSIVAGTVVATTTATAKGLSPWVLGLLLSGGGVAIVGVAAVTLDWSGARDQRTSAPATPHPITAREAPSDVTSTIAPPAVAPLAAPTAPSTVPSSAPSTVASSAPSTVASSAPPTVASSAPPTVASSAPPTVASSAPPATTSSTTAAAPRPHAVSHARPSDRETSAPDPTSTLAGELELVRSATAAINEQRWLQAIDGLDQHASRFPRGALAQERSGLRALSLCKLGRSDGKDAAARFIRTYPDSPMIERLRASCEELP